MSLRRSIVRRSIVTRLTVLSLGLSTLAGALVAPTAVNAQALPPPEAAELCRLADESGELAALGITRGECESYVMGPASEQANNFIAALCGVESVQAQVGATSKGECIKIVRDPE